MYIYLKQFIPICLIFGLLLTASDSLSERIARQKSSEVAEKRSGVRGKRSDDGGLLQAVVDQLASQVTSLTTQLTSLNSEMVALKARAANLETTVAFYAWNTDRPVQVLPNDILVLNHAVTNIGNAYDTMTGVFTAPVSGLYDFQASVMPNSHGQQVYTSMLVEGNLVGIVVADTDADDWDIPTMRALVHVEAGQRVMLRNGGTSGQYFSALGEPYTAFSGHLVKAD